MLDTLISSRTRINLLLKFFINPQSTSYLRGLAEEFKESTNAIRIELNRFENAGMLDSNYNGNRKMYKANVSHPLYKDIRNIILKHVGIDKLIEELVEKLGNPEKVYLCGDFAMGKNSEIIDIVIIGDINKNYMLTLIEKVEPLIKKRIRYLTFLPQEFNINEQQKKDYVLIWNK
jgi:predicted nucleotidyltransferase